MRILIDMDGVIADWGAEWDRRMDLIGDRSRHIPRHAQQRTFDLNQGRTNDEKAIIRTVMSVPGFYASLHLIEGAREALHGMIELGHDVRIVTSPWISNPTCASDKLAWVEHHLGAGWGLRVIITSDKTLVAGDFLIDDKPSVTGIVENPAWDHILFDQPYNREVTDRLRLVGWASWPEVLWLGSRVA